MIYSTLRAKYKYLRNNCEAKKIFIVGTGRSGTHWIARAISSHPLVRSTIEKQPIFGWVKKMALDPSARGCLMPKLIRRYRWQGFLKSPYYYLDKSHPNIWIVEDLAETFRDAIFIGILRNPFAVVNSMLEHDGVLKWHRRWNEFPVPNRFLGITKKNRSYYEELPIASKCALRWKSHKNRIYELDNKIGSRLKVVDYESFAINTEKTVKELSKFIGLEDPIPKPKVKKSSLEKWKDGLSTMEKEQVSRVIGGNEG